MSDYITALRAGGATVHKYEEYGSYQGQWMAHVTLPSGETGFIIDSYGSCSGCDAYQDMMGYRGHDCGPRNGAYVDEVPQYAEGAKLGCSKCSDETAKIAEFGASYFKQLLTKEEALRHCTDHDYGEYKKMAADIAGI